MTKKQLKGGPDAILPTRPPAYLGKIAAAAWRKCTRFLNDRGNVKVSDEKLLEQYVTDYEIFRHAYDHIKENGEVQKIYKSLQDASGEIIDKDFIGFKRNPMTSIYSDAQKNLKAIGAELGLSPKSRSELLKILDDDNEDDESSGSVDEFK